MIIPPFLKPGDTIGITCPAGYVATEQILFAKEVFERWGYQVILGETVGQGEYYFAGDDALRRKDLQKMLDDPNIRAIIAGRGGYGTSKLIDQLDYQGFVRNPKWICGFSDITALHSDIHQKSGIATLHSPMCRAFSPESEYSDTIQSLRRALSGEALVYETGGSTYNRPGTAEGLLVGGNLALLGHLTGSGSQLDTKGKILFIEDIGEHLYQIDRLLLTLRRSGQLEGLKGLLVGSFTDIEDTTRPYGKGLEEIISEMVADYDFPLAFGFPCGHDLVNFTLQLGLKQRLVVDKDFTRIELLDDRFHLATEPISFTIASHSH